MKWEVARERSGKWDIVGEMRTDKKVSGVICHHLVMRAFCMMFHGVESDFIKFVRRFGVS